MSDTKLADLTALTAPSGDDLLYVVDDPAGTPLDRKITIDDLFKRPSASNINWNSDLFLTRRAAANLRFGAADAAAPVAQTLSVQGGSGTDIAGQPFTIEASRSTGTAAGGSILFHISPAGGSSGTAVNTPVIFGEMTSTRRLSLYNTYTDATTFERANIFWDSNVLKIGTEKGSVGGTARALEFQTDGTTRLTIAAAAGTITGAIFKATAYFDAPAGALNSNGGIYFGVTGTGAQIQATAVGVLALANYAATDFDRLQFGGTTSSFPALKRSTTFLQARLADDSAFAGFAAANVQAATAYTVATLPTPATGMIARVTDATLPVIGATVAGGGAAYALVNYNGANWTVIGV
jgi:hypothetical protein